MPAPRKPLLAAVAIERKIVTPSVSLLVATPSNAQTQQHKPNKQHEQHKPSLTSTLNFKAAAMFWRNIQTLKPSNLFKLFQSQ
jgi:hypothetical protein